MSDQIRKRSERGIESGSVAREELYEWASDVHAGHTRGATASPDPINPWWRLVLLILGAPLWVAGLGILYDSKDCRYIRISDAGRSIASYCRARDFSAVTGEVLLPGLLVGLVLVLGYLALLAWAIAPIVRANGPEKLRHTGRFTLRRTSLEPEE